MVCVLVMLTGGILWAYIIGSMAGILGNMDPHGTPINSMIFTENP